MNTTIAAISTAVSASGIGIIRISGPEAMDVIDVYKRQLQYGVHPGRQFSDNYS